MQNNTDINSVIDDIVHKHADLPGALLPILHDIQDEIGHIPDGSINAIAQGLNLSRAEVHGVISFYHHFKTKPRGKHIIEICAAESCQAVGGRELAEYAKRTLGIDWNETTADQQFTLEPVYCLGHCACSPALRVKDQMVARADQPAFDALITELSTDIVKLV